MTKETEKINYEEEAKKIKEIEWGWQLGKIIGIPYLFLKYHPKIINKKYIPKKGPILLCGNHTHKLDPFLVGASTRRTVHYLAKDAYDKGKLSLIFRIVGTIPVDREHGDPLAVERAKKLLRKNKAVGLFPEGTRNKTKEFLLPFKFGAVSMAQKTGASIVPFGITGKFEKGDNKLTIRFGKPFKVEKDESLEKANNELRDKIGSLMKESLNEEKK